jgi:hypothetical protein
MWPNPRIPYQMSSDRSRLTPLKGKPIMVNPVVAIEYWPFDRPVPRGILPAPHGRTSEPPEVANYSWVEYGLRCGLPQIFELFERRGIKITAGFSGPSKRSRTKRRRSAAHSRGWSGLPENVCAVGLAPARRRDDANARGPEALQHPVHA